MLRSAFKAAGLRSLQAAALGKEQQSRLDRAYDDKFYMYSRRRAGSRRDELGAGLGVWLELGWLGLAWLCHSQPKSTFHVKSIKKASVFEGDMDFDQFITAS